MIDFGLTEDQEALQRAAREFLAAGCPPALVRENAESGDGIPRGLYKKMAELEWMGLVVPEMLGGLGLAEGDQALEPAGIRTTAKKTRDGWTLNGSKVFVQDAPGVDVLLVAARTKAGTGPAGVSLFLVERRAKGVKVRPQEGFDLTRRT